VIPRRDPRGVAFIEGADELFKFAKTTIGASNDADLDVAADHLAESYAQLRVHGSRNFIVGLRFPSATATSPSRNGRRRGSPSATSSSAELRSRSAS
jgi:hypothetical protein